jgi:hypothetical protein
MAGMVFGNFARVDDLVGYHEFNKKVQFFDGGG